MHRVVTSNPAERRLARLVSPTADDNRISYGCINVPVAFYETYIRPMFARYSGILTFRTGAGQTPSQRGMARYSALPGTGFERNRGQGSSCGLVLGGCCGDLGHGNSCWPRANRAPGKSGGPCFLQWPNRRPAGQVFLCGCVRTSHYLKHAAGVTTKISSRKTATPSPAWAARWASVLPKQDV